MGRFEIVGELGAGGMGVVYRARDAELGRDVALKLVRLEPRTDQSQGRARLQREAQALAQLSHPNVITVYDVGRVDDGVFLAMELVEGERLDSWNKSRKHGWREALAVYRDVARGLAAAHRLGLVHRDIKPANLILGADGRVRVLDFGLARSAMLGPKDVAKEAASRAQPATVSEATLGDGRPVENLDPTVSIATRGRPAGEATATLPPERPAAKEAVPELVHDFGSAAQSGSHGSHSSGNLLETPLTQAGAIVGTPPYMAPEQHLGLGCDARSDQFSFCVAFYQALYGERPFAGGSYDALCDNVLAGRVRPAPSGAKVPVWLRQVLLRGLEVTPEKRWPSMDALGEALERDPALRRRRIATAAGVLALGAACGLAIGYVQKAGRECSGAASRLAGVWDEARKQAVHAVFDQSGRAYAQDAFRAVERALDAYAQSWTALRIDACEATRVRGEQSPELLDLRMQCLDLRLEELRAQVDVFSAADGDVVEHAARAAAQLPALDGCADTAALKEEVRPPADAAQKRRVTDAQKRLAKVRALWVSGQYPKAMAQLGPAVDEARALKYRPLEAMALHIRADLEEAQGDYEAAARDYREARISAEAGRADKLASSAATALVYVLGVRLGKLPEAHAEVGVAEALLERIGKNDLARADLETRLGALAAVEGKLDESLSRNEKALELKQKHLAPDDPSMETALHNLGDACLELGRFPEAIAWYRRAIDVGVRTLGAQHPWVADTQTNYATALSGLNRYDEALVEYRRALASQEVTLGPEHPTLGTVHLKLGDVLLAQAKLDEAAAEYTRARDLWSKALGAEHPNVGTAWYHLGQVALERGRLDEAQAGFGQALEIWQAKLGAEHPSLSAALTGLGDVQLERRHTREALAHYQRARRLLEKAVGTEHPDLANPLTGIGLVELALGEPQAALEPLERALVLREKVPGEVRDTARTRFALARALFATGAHARALELARSAQHDYASLGATAQKPLTAVEKFLGTRSPPATSRD